MKATVFLILAISFSVLAGKLPLENGFIIFLIIDKKDHRKLFIFVR